MSRDKTMYTCIAMYPAYVLVGGTPEEYGSHLEYGEEWDIEAGSAEEARKIAEERAKEEVIPGWDHIEVVPFAGIYIGSVSL